MSKKDILPLDSPKPLEQEPEQQEEEPPIEYKPYKVFINNVDSYNAKYIAAYITDQIFGLKRLMPGAGPDEGLGEGEEAPVPLPIENVPTEHYEFIGTLTSDYTEYSEDISFIVSESETEQFKEHILKSGFIIYDITADRAEISKALKALSLLTEELDEIEKLGPKTYEHFTDTKVFILISTIMTWALTKPLDRNDPDLPFSEVDYKKRRPHPNFKEHYNCEKEVIKTGQKYKNKLKTYVVCSGLIYGEEEECLEFYFKMAWFNETLPIFGNGNNKLPFISVKDLAKAMHGLMEIRPVKPQYILAVEQSPTSLKQFIKSLSKALSDNKTKNVVAEEAFLYNNMTQTIFDISTVNLNMEPVFLVENLQLEWQSELTIAENMNQVVSEFKQKRRLKPMKIIIHGPPGSGKTYLAKELCEFYNCKYVSVASMLEDFLTIWKESMIRPEKPKLEETEMLAEEELEEEVEEEDPQQILEQIREMQMFLEGGIEKIPDTYITGLLKSYLGKNFCQNRGYVLDDYPQMTEQAKELFGQGANEGGEEEEVEVVDVGKILPDLVVSLVATDEYISHQIMKLPEEEIKDTSHAEEVILQRLDAYREINTDDNTVLNYFDELEVDILLLEVTEETFKDNFSMIVNTLGPPSTFGLSPEEEKELRRIQSEEKRLALELEVLNIQKELDRAEEERKKKMEAWSETLEKLQMEEEKILIAQSEPLRHYLMKYVFPTLTKGLIELAKLKPEDPIDFLAEYLFKENPEGKMFDPSYNVECEELYGEFRGLIEKIIDEHETFH